MLPWETRQAFPVYGWALQGLEGKVNCFAIANLQRRRQEAGGRRQRLTVQGSCISRHRWSDDSERELGTLKAGRA